MGTHPLRPPGVDVRLDLPLFAFKSLHFLWCAVIKLGFHLTLLFSVFFIAKIAIAEQDSSSQQQKVVSETARLYLESNNGYQPGDLITESQIEELQHYLRKSLGKSPATHRGLLNRTLKDTAPLSRFFYREQGNQVLRSAAEKLGGYVKLEALSLEQKGRQALQRAISTGSEAEIVTMVEASRQNSSEKPTSEQKKTSPYHLRVIYTLEDFLEAAFAKSSEKIAL